MNKYERYAAAKYQENKMIDDESLTILECCYLAKEQDSLYKVIHLRVDARNLNKKAPIRR